MELFFRPTDLGSRSRGLTFDDVLLTPEHCEISSRKTPTLKTRLTKNKSMSLPFISANMDTVTEVEMAHTLSKLGAHGILHRFMDEQTQADQVRKLVQLKSDAKNPESFWIGASIGVKEAGLTRAEKLVEAGVEVLTIDIAHGDSVMMLETLEVVKKRYPQIEFIVGNVATAQGVRRLIDAGADCVKVGIGPGSMCTTRIITGCGVPQLTAISLCVQEAMKNQIPVIADGGIKTSGDVAKALACGADSVMLGSMLAGCLETPGEIQGGMKKYRGMASQDAQVSWRGNMQKGMAAEGESRLIPCKGSVVDIIDELSGGVRSAMTYLNSAELSEMPKRARFMEISSAGLYESKPHGMN